MKKAILMLMTGVCVSAAAYSQTDTARHMGKPNKGSRQHVDSSHDKGTMNRKDLNNPTPNTNTNTGSPNNDNNPRTPNNSNSGTFDSGAGRNQNNNMNNLNNQNNGNMK